jgi:RimJ/RimL family protein N-acetyltransferase/ADP-ribose pyrophosphatase YjhB (NUDIX family)
MKETTLVHIIKDGCVLMMHRISKKHDINHGKWIGVGGKFERGETPEACMRREVREETGLVVDQYRYCGIVTFVSDEDETEYMHLFTVKGFHDRDGGSVRDGRNGSREGIMGGIRLRECDEGKLEWLPKEKLTQIPHWAGDRIFLPLILDVEIPFFSMKLVYRRGELVHASLNEHNCLVTERLVLRPWLDADADALYLWAKNPKIGRWAGWLPHEDVEDSREIIRNVLARPEIYAIVLRDTAQPIGAVGLQNFRLVDADGTMLAYFDERKSEDPLICSRPESPADEAQSDVSQPDARQSDARQSDARQADVPQPHVSSCCQEQAGEKGGSLDAAGSDPAAPGSCTPGLPDGMCVEAALGYWLAEPFWQQGIMHEAAGAVLEHARKDLGIRRVWADYYEGNDRSLSVMERLGFHFHHIEKDRYVEAFKERRTSIFQVKYL